MRSPSYGGEAATVGVDLGGTKIAAAIVDTHGQPHNRYELETPRRDATAVIDAIEVAVRLAGGDLPVESVGVGAAGLVMVDRSTVLYAPNLPLQRTPLGRCLSERLRLPVVVENDGNAAAWAESQFGAAAGSSTMVMLTIGTGVGGGIILDGKLLRGTNGIAAEVGHLSVTDTGPPCGCGSVGCLEAHASGTALVREAKRLATEAPERAKEMLRLVNGRPDQITGPQVATAAHNGDPAAVEAFRVVGTWLGRGMASLVALLDADTFVLGGGVAAVGDVLMRPAIDTMNALIVGRRLRPEPAVRSARLGNDAGLIGAASLAGARRTEPQPAT